MDDVTIGVVGAGLIGGSIVLGAHKAGFSVIVYDQDNSGTELKLGAPILWAATITEVALASDLIFIQYRPLSPRPKHC
jgi:prephenate dehydrogenase